MMGMTQDKVRDGSTPRSAPLFYSEDFDIRYEEFCYKEGRLEYPSFTLRCPLAFGFVGAPLLRFLSPFLLSQSLLMASKRQFRRDGGSREASGLSIVKGKSLKRQMRQTT